MESEGRVYHFDIQSAIFLGSNYYSLSLGFWISGRFLFCGSKVDEVFSIGRGLRVQG